MKYTLAVLALLSYVSAEKLVQHKKVIPYLDDKGYVVMHQELVKSKHHKKGKKDKPSNEVCDGDSAEDKQLEHEGDQNDEIVEDTGFSGSRGHTIRLQMASEVHENPIYKDYFDKHDKYSDSIANGDRDDDKEVQKEMDPHDDIVEDWGFRGTRAHTHLQTTADVHQMSNAQLNAMLNARAKYSFNKESDGTCDGDSADNKEISDTADPEDTVVEDFGFSGSRNARGQVRLLQTGAKLGKFSDELVDGDASDDRVVQQEEEGLPDIPSFVELDAKFQDYPINQEHMNILYTVTQPSDEYANGDSADNKELQWEHDPNDPIVDYNGHTNRGYAHTRYDDPENHFAFDNAHYSNNNVANLFPGHFGTVPRGDNPVGGHEE